jgi:hypothetical protein
LGPKILAWKFHRLSFIIYISCKVIIIGGGFFCGARARAVDLTEEDQLAKRVQVRVGGRPSSIHSFMMCIMGGCVAHISSAVKPSGRDASPADDQPSNQA